MLERSQLDSRIKNECTDTDSVPNQARTLRLVPTSCEPQQHNAARSTQETARRADVIEGRFESQAGALDYILHAPACRSGAEMSLVVMLHGAGQDPADFAAGTLMHAHAAAEDTWVLYPGQSRDVPLRCWTWFGQYDQARGQGEPALLASLTRWIVAEHGISPRRVYAAGLSAGAAMAVVLGQTYPDLYAAIGSHSGLPYAAATDVFAALDVMARGPADRQLPHAGGARVPTIVFHGDADRTVHLGNANAIVAAVINGTSIAGRPVTTRRAANGGRRSHTTTTYRDSRDRDCVEQWIVHEAGHAWSGGSAEGSHTDPAGPDATGAMLRFFRSHELAPRCAG
ncbi:MAG TPA: PHB depolymerase family esterase [Casimicrobiaceae bacterium]|nr:PHB depolymerase family esterase [Casimicrobiaceae bacterium]